MTCYPITNAGLTLNNCASCNSGASNNFGFCKLELNPLDNNPYGWIGCGDFRGAGPSYDCCGTKWNFANGDISRGTTYTLKMWRVDTGSGATAVTTYYANLYPQGSSTAINTTPASWATPAGCGGAGNSTSCNGGAPYGFTQSGGVGAGMRMKVVEDTHEGLTGEEDSGDTRFQSFSVCRVGTDSGCTH